MLTMRTTKEFIFISYIFNECFYETPLIKACQYCEDAVPLLIEKGAFVNVKDYSNNKVLFYYYCIYFLQYSSPLCM